MAEYMSPMLEHLQDEPCCIKLKEYTEMLSAQAVIKLGETLPSDQPITDKSEDAPPDLSAFLATYQLPPGYQKGHQPNPRS
jgi:hypothetical protein